MSKQSSTPYISVIVLNWNGKHFLEACLSSLRLQVFRNFEAILVDNGSDDGSVDYVGRNFPEVRVLALGRNVGFASGNNAGYEEASGELIVLLNNDTEAHPNWLAEIATASRNHPTVASFACKMVYFDERNKIDNCGFDLTVAGTTVDLGRDELDGPPWNEPRNVFGPCGGAATYRRSMLQDIGFLDSDLFIFFEDVDLSFRGQLRGYTCMFVPCAIVYHRYRATMSKHRPRQVFFSQRNVEFLYLKNMPLGLLFRFLPVRLIYEIGSAVYFFKQGVGNAFLKAKWDALRQTPSVLRKRREIQRNRTVNNHDLRLILDQNGWLTSKGRKFALAWHSGPQKVAPNSHPTR